MNLALDILDMFAQEYLIGIEENKDRLKEYYKTKVTCSI
jgi:hypothetical protein